MKRIMILVFALALSVNYATGQTRSERKALKKEKREKAFKELKDLIDSGNYQFVARRALPLGNDISRLNLMPNNVFQGNVVDLTSNPNYLKMQDDSLSVALPFFGRVFRTVGTYGTANGIEFKGEYEDYKVKLKERKGMIIINFDADNKHDFMQYTLSVGSLNYATLTVNTTNRQSITYQGTISPLEEGTDDSN
ncbi:DUF4251 domain-containing protein [Winogradskyella maritima]|uniref:DUF4251 domain-containing protein n=1 Tax=Winogradskyella maritima TaxID=1517766 RepID=A0ABV8AIZ0_9FLAO|nr:DUF4251 domain-containing protein [Winogradskyella maritima]